MKAVTITLIVLFAVVAVFFSVVLIMRAVSGQNGDRVAETAQSSADTISEGASTATTETASTETVPPLETTGPTQPDENIREIQIFLDGDKDNGIAMGKATYELDSPDAAQTYGQDFSKFGFSLDFDAGNYKFDPGTKHSIYVYSYIPAYGWEHSVAEITVPGKELLSETIRMSVDSISDNSILAIDGLKEIRISGWAADLGVAQNTGIAKVEVYLDGPKNFGRSLGQAQYGLERADVGNAMGNANYNNSGYYLAFDGSSFTPGSTHKIYVYAFTPSGAYQYLVRNIIVEGEPPAGNVLVKADATFLEGKVQISGWAINMKFITQGVPRALDIEYILKKIVFVSNLRGNEDIFSMNLDGSELTQLTDSGGRDQYPAISPDGKKIAYSADIGGTWQIVVMNWDGTGKKQITFGPDRHGYPSWSFDGRYIFIEIYVEGNWELYVMESDGSKLKRLTMNPGVEDWHPNAHPFEYKVLYEVGHTGNEQAFEMNLDGSNIRQVSKPGVSCRVPKYSIDGLRIVYMGNSDGREQIFTMDLNGENIIQLTDAPEGARLPGFSPDNKFIVYNSSGAAQEIIIMNTDGSGKTQLTNNPGDDWGAVFMYQQTD